MIILAVMPGVVESIVEGHRPSTLGMVQNIMRKSWLIIGLVVAGGLYYWIGDEEQPEIVSEPEPQETKQTFGPYGRIPDRAPQAQPDRWRSQEIPPQPVRQKDGYAAVTPVPEFGSYIPPYSKHSFRPLNGEKQTQTRRIPQQVPDYSAPARQQDYRAEPVDPRYQPYDTQRYNNWAAEEPVTPAVPGYRFRPLESRGQPKRWIGNYPRIPSTGPFSPMRSYPPDPGASYAYYR